MTTALKETIYDLAEARRALDLWLIESEGELTPELEPLWDEWQGKFTDKVENTVLLITELLSRAKSRKAEEERIEQGRKSLEGKAERLKRLLEIKMQEVGKMRVDGLLVTAALETNPPKVEPVSVLDEPELRNIASFAPRYVRHEESWSLNKKAILEDHKAGTLDAEMAKRIRVVQTLGLRIR